jgi:HSP20 family protein
MKTVRWEPLGNMLSQMNLLQREMNRLFDRWTDAPERWQFGTPQYPLVNVWEDAEAVYVQAELPGLDLKDLEIYVTGGSQLTLKGERKRQVGEKAIFHRQERSIGNFVRVLTLPFTVNSDKVEARLENGILQVKLAKHESAKPRKIVVKSE